MYITKKHLSRRTMLRGMGYALSLPLLDAMIPASTALANTAAAPNPRLGFIYFPHGAIMARWMPEATGTNFVLPQILKPLEPYRSSLTVVSGLRNKAGESPAPHAIIASDAVRAFLGVGESAAADAADLSVGDIAARERDALLAIFCNN